MAVAALPAIITAGSALAGGAFAMSQANYQAQVAKNNAAVADYNAARAGVVGGIEAQMKDMEYAQLIGEQTARQAASGVSVSGISQIRSRAAARMYAAADRNTIMENAQMENHNYKVEATNFRADAKAAKASGRAAMVEGVLSAAGSIAGIPKVQSLIGRAASAAKNFGRSPVPIPKPRLRPTIGAANPLVRPRYNTRYPV